MLCGLGGGAAVSEGIVPLEPENRFLFSRNLFAPCGIFWMRGGISLRNEGLSTNAEIADVLETYADMVYKLALSRCKNPSDAEDIFQEVFLRYISANVAFESEEHRKAWLLRVTLNCGNKLFSSAWMRHRAPMEEQSLAAAPAPESGDESGLLTAVQKLPVVYRTVIHLFYYEDMSIKQISLLLGKKEGTIKSQLNRARALLKKELKGEFDDVPETL